MLLREGEGDVTRLEFALEEEPEEPKGREKQSSKTCDEANQGEGEQEATAMTAFGPSDWSSQWKRGNRGGTVLHFN
jgi:hypothetical protein